VKIAIASDLHLEFGDLDFDNQDAAEVLILSGDILVAKDVADRDTHDIMGAEYRSNRFHGFMQRCTERFRHVIYIVGNHEHYHGYFAVTVSHLREKFGYMPNLYILDHGSITIGDVTFIGGTLWTDMNQEDPTTLYHMTSMMNDFRCVQNSNRTVSFKADVLRDKPVGMTDDEFLELPTSERFKPVFKTRVAKFSPEDAVAEHRKFVSYIRTVIEGQFDQKFVIVGHHAPSRLSTHPRYAADTIMNGGYSSSLDEFVIDHPQIKLWTHGHTHEDFDYMIGSTRIVCNPRGYINYEHRADQWQLKTVDI
jgi:Icc-related predicted phosphoesterase